MLTILLALRNVFPARSVGQERSIPSLEASPLERESFFHAHERIKNPSLEASPLKRDFLPSLVHGKTFHARPTLQERDMPSFIEIGPAV